MTVSAGVSTNEQADLFGPELSLTDVSLRVEGCKKVEVVHSKVRTCLHESESQFVHHCLGLGDVGENEGDVGE